MVRKLNLQSVPHRELRSSTAGESYSLSAVLSGELGLKDLFVHHEIIPPGRRASGTHFHTRREEVAMVLDGEVVAHCDGVDFALRSGDVVAFPPGLSGAHSLRNEAPISARVLSVASNPAGDEVRHVEAVRAG